MVASNRDLEQLSRDGQFRLDLFYRLNAFTLNVPPLRARREDIPELANYFLANHRFSARVDKVFSAEAMQRLISYDFPGNIRELRNIVERAVIVSGADRELRARHLALRSGQPGTRSALTLSFDHEPTLEEIEQSYLTLMLKRYGGHRGKVAEILAVSERSVYRRLQKSSASIDRR
jgi:transcriptional regulator with PAS, ATPase and Fis domain